MNTDRRTRSLQLTTFALTAAGSLAACGAANTPESATPAVAEEAAQTPAAPAEPAAPAPAASAPAYEQTSPPPQPEPSPKPQESAGNEQAAPEKKDPEPTSVTITTLSKGRGVPAPTRDAYKEIRGLLEEQKSQSAVTNIETQRVGIEGEMRMCAEFRDRDQAEYALEQIRKISADVELLNVVEGPCPPTQRDKP